MRCESARAPKAVQTVTVQHVRARRTPSSFLRGTGITSGPYDERPTGGETHKHEQLRPKPRRGDGPLIFSGQPKWLGIGRVGRICVTLFRPPHIPHPLSGWRRCERHKLGQTAQGRQSESMASSRGQQTGLAVRSCGADISSPGTARTLQKRGRSSDSQADTLCLLVLCEHVSVPEGDRNNFGPRREATDRRRAAQARITSAGPRRERQAGAGDPVDGSQPWAADRLQRRSCWLTSPALAQRVTFTK